MSAARAVAHSTTFLVEGADGLVNGTHSLEQLIVAANEVGGFFSFNSQLLPHSLLLLLV